MPQQIIDLSHRLTPGMPVFPGDAPLAIEVVDATTQSGRQPRSRLNSSRLNIGLHCGTHMDAPYHFFGDGDTIDQVLLEVCVGECVLSALDARPKLEIDARHLEPFAAEMRGVPRVVVHTGWFRQWGSDAYFSDHPRLTRCAAELLVRCGVRLVGVDFPSVDQPPHEAHLELLGAGVVILENLTNLDQIQQARFELVAVPLAIAGRDGSPVRALARVGRA